MKIRQITRDKDEYMDLLLLADPQEDMIEKYLDRSDMFVLVNGGDVCSVCVVEQLKNRKCELKNLATRVEDRGKGYAKYLLRYICERYSSTCDVMYVGTGNYKRVVNFYEKCGFINSHIVANFFTENYREVAEKTEALLQYAEPNPYAYGYNDACTAFARGESAMYTIGNYAIPQIKSVNPDINIDSFTFPANESEADNVLNSGVDLHFCVMKETKNKEAVYEVLRFLYEDETINIYLEDQGGIACKEGDFELPAELEGMRAYIEAGRMTDYQDHHYPSEMSVDAMIQTFLLDESDNAVDTFLARFDSDWTRYNKDLIWKVQQYQKEH